MITLTNTVELSHSMIEAILEDHNIPHKLTADNRILALDISYQNDKLIKVWIFAPTLSHKLFEWLGY